MACDNLGNNNLELPHEHDEHNLRVHQHYSATHQLIHVKILHLLSPLLQGSLWYRTGPATESTDTLDPDIGCTALQFIGMCGLHGHSGLPDHLTV